jgi:hypothetical protein
MDFVTAYFMLAAIFLAVLRFHPQGMEEDLLADAVVATAWGPVALFMGAVLALARPQR